MIRTGQMDYPGNWNNFWGRNIRKIHFDLHTDPTETDLGKGFDPAAFAAGVKEAGAQAAVFFCRCGVGYSYYPTKVGIPHPHLKTDLFGSVADELKRQELGVIAYMALTELSDEEAAAHPDWVGKFENEADLNLKVSGQWLQACPSSSFWEESFIPQMEEIARSYPIGGIWIDGIYNFFHQPCYCDRCRSLYDGSIPEDIEDLNWRRYHKFIQELVWGKLNECGRALHAVNSELVIGSDWVGSLPWAYPAPEEFDFNTGDIRFDNGALNAAFAFSFWTWRGKPADVNMQRSYWWQDFNTRSIYDIQREFAATLASCGTFMLGDTLRPFDMRLEDEKIRFYSEAFGSTAALEPIVKGARPKADIALLVSPEQQRAQGREWTISGFDRREGDPIYGAYSALVEAGLTVHSLCDADLEEHLAGYRLLVLPELDFISPEAVSAIERYVEEGGRIVAIGRIPAAVPASADLNNAGASDRSAFERLLGLRFEEQSDEVRTFFDPSVPSLAAMWPEDVHRLPVGVPGTATRTELAGAQMIAPLAGPSRNVQGGVSMGTVLSSPAFSSHGVGKGQAWFIAQPLAAAYMIHGYRGATAALQAIVLEALGLPFARRHGGSCVQLLLTEKKNETACHLISYAGDMRSSGPRMVSTPAAIAGISVELRTDRRVKSAMSVTTATALSFVQRDGVITVDVPSFKLWESIRILWA